MPAKPLIVVVASTLSAALWLGSACAQNFDGTWTGSTGCPAYGPQVAYTEPATATIIQNQFRLERNTAGLSEITQGTVGANGFVSAGGEGQRRDRPLNWINRFSGQASATTMNLTGTRNLGRPCWIHLTNTQPASYSLAGIDATQRAAQKVPAEKTEGAPPPTTIVKPRPLPVAAVKPEPPQSNESTQIEEMRQTTNFLLHLNVSNAEILAPGDTPAALANFGTAWQSPTIKGAVKIFFDKPKLTGLAVISELTDADSQKCKGKFASGRWSGLVDSEVIFQADTECHQTTIDRSAHYWVVPRDKGGFYAYLILSSIQPQNDQKATTTQSTSEEQINIYRKAAVAASIATDQKE